MGTVSIAVPFTDRWYFAEIARGARDRAAEAGHDVRLHVIPPSATATAEAAAAITRDFADEDAIGAVVAGFKYQADQRERVLAWRRPVVLIGGSALGFPTVSIDDVGAGRIAVEHLLGLGHRRIVHLAGDLADQMDFSVHGRRARGYRSTMESAGLRPDVVEVRFDPADVRRAALEVLRRPEPPTAVFAVSDEIALEVLRVAAELGLRPGEDLSVVGVDDHPDAEAAGLTTVRQRPADMAATAVDLLLGGLSHGPDPKQSRLHAISLVQRSSTGRLRSPRERTGAGAPADAGRRGW